MPALAMDQVNTLTPPGGCPLFPFKQHRPPFQRSSPHSHLQAARPQFPFGRHSGSLHSFTARRLCCLSIQEMHVSTQVSQSLLTVSIWDASRSHLQADSSTVSVWGTSGSHLQAVRPQFLIRRHRPAHTRASSHPHPRLPPLSQAIGKSKSSPNLGPEPAS